MVVACFSYNCNASLTDPAHWLLDKDCFSNARSSLRRSVDSFPTCFSNLSFIRKTKKINRTSCYSLKNLIYQSKLVSQRIQLCIQLGIRKSIEIWQIISRWWILERHVQRHFEIQIRSVGLGVGWHGWRGLAYRRWKYCIFLASRCSFNRWHTHCVCCWHS